MEITKIAATCPVTGTSHTLWAHCPKLQLNQILKFTSNRFDAVQIAETRWAKAQRIRKHRKIKRAKAQLLERFAL